LPVSHGTVSRRKVTVDLDAIPFRGVPDVGTLQVVLLGPEERHTASNRSRTEYVACGNLALPFGDDPMLDADRLAGQPVGPSGYVAGGPDPGNIRLKIGVDSDAAIDRDPACSASIVSGRTPMPTTTKSAASCSPLCNVTWLRSNEAGVVPRWKTTPPRSINPIFARSLPVSRSISHVFERDAQPQIAPLAD